MVVFQIRLHKIEDLEQGKIDPWLITFQTYDQISYFWYNNSTCLLGAVFSLYSSTFLMQVEVLSLIWKSEWMKIMLN